ncbi:MAG: hypothetical protein GY772_00795, partial [bacterium]|nr:hypothetical protein [bacterium]
MAYLAGTHASGTVCATGTYTAEEHRALQISEWTDERGKEKVTVTATWVQQIVCTLDKEEFETVGVKDLAEKMARRVKTVQSESSESDVTQQITDMIVRETRARRRGHLETRAEPLQLGVQHLVELPPVKTEVDQQAVRERDWEHVQARRAWQAELERGAEEVAAEPRRERARRESGSEVGSGWASAVGEEPEPSIVFPPDEVMVPSNQTPDYNRSSPESTSDASSTVVTQRQVRRPVPMEVDSPKRTTGDRNRDRRDEQSCAAARRDGDDESLAATDAAPVEAATLAP